MHHIVWIRNFSMKINLHNQRSLGVGMLFDNWLPPISREFFSPSLSRERKRFRASVCRRMWEKARNWRLTTKKQMHFKRNFHSFSHIQFSQCHIELNRIELNSKNDFFQTSIYFVAIIHHLACSSDGERDKQVKFKLNQKQEPELQFDSAVPQWQSFLPISLIRVICNIENQHQWIHFIAPIVTIIEYTGDR